MSASVKTKVQDTVVHESEIQRQHIRLPLPATAIIGGKSYIIKDLSVGGFSVTDIDGAFESGKSTEVRIILPFGSFSMDLNIRADIRHYDRSKKTLGCRFADLNADQISLLNHVLKAFMAGDVVTSNGLLNVAGRENFTKARKQAGSKSDSAPVVSLSRQLPGLAVIALLGLTAAFVIVTNIYQSLFVVKSEAAVVESPVLEIRATTDGYYVPSLGPDTVTIKPDQAVATVSPASGANLGAPVKSPCDCYITEAHVQKGEFVTAGTPLLSVVDIAAKPSIRAIIDPRKAGKIGINGRTRIFISGSQSEYTGRVTDIVTDLDAQTILPAGAGISGTPIFVDIALDQRIPVDLTGRPAQVVFSSR